MSAIVPGKLGLVAHLKPIVELLRDADAHLTRRPAKVKAHPARGQASDNQAQKRGKQLSVLQVRTNRVGHPGVLNLDRDRATVMQASGMHLANRGRREWLPLELGKRALGSAAKLALKHHARKFRCHRWCVTTQACKRPLVDPSGTPRARQDWPTRTRATAPPSSRRPWSARAVRRSARPCERETRSYPRPSPCSEVPAPPPLQRYEWSEQPTGRCAERARVLCHHLSASRHLQLGEARRRALNVLSVCTGFS